MKAIGIKLINAFPEEIKSHDYNVKGFFFIGKPGKSVNPDNKDRTVIKSTIGGLHFIHFHQIITVSME